MAKIVLSPETKLQIAKTTGLTFLASNIEKYFDSSQGAEVKALLEFYSTTLDVIDEMHTVVMPKIQEDCPEINFDTDPTGLPILTSTAPSQLIVGQVAEFEATTIANGYAGQMVYSTIKVTNKEALKIEYWEPNEETPSYHDLPLNEAGEFQFGANSGFPCADATFKFCVTALAEAVCDIVTKLVLVEDKSTLVEITSQITITSGEEPEPEPGESIDVEYDGSNSEINEPEKDVTFAATQDVTTPVEIVGKNVTVNGMTVKSVVTKVQGSGVVELNNVIVDGNIDKETSNAGVIVNSEDNMVIDGMEFNATGYNSVEVGLNSLPKNVTIRNCKFIGKMSNNAISVFGLQEGGQLLIQDCEFEDVSNAVRLSNKENVAYNVKIERCKCKNWVTGNYAGFLLFQDYNSKTWSAAVAANQAAKLNIEFVDCVGPNDVPMVGELANHAALKEEGQWIYCYAANKIIQYAENPEMYPTVTFK